MKLGPILTLTGLLLAGAATAGEGVVVNLAPGERGNPEVYFDWVMRSSTSGPVGGLANASPELLTSLNAALTTGDRAALAAILAQIDAELAARGIAATD